MTDTPEPSPCPVCAGLSRPDHPLGVLAGWAHATTCLHLRHQDGQTMADVETLSRSRRSTLTRPATATELTLLAAAGYVWPATGALQTHVRARPYARAWPAATHVPPEEEPA